MKNTALAIGFGLLLMLATACGSDPGDDPQTDGDGVDRAEVEAGDRETNDGEAESVDRAESEPIDTDTGEAPDGDAEETAIEQDAETIETDSDCPEPTGYRCYSLGGFCDGGQYGYTCVLDEQGCLVSRDIQMCDGAAVCSGGKCVCSSIYNYCEYEQDGMTTCEGSVVVTCTYYGGTCGHLEKGTDCALQNKSCQNGSCVAGRRAAPDRSFR